LTRISRVKFLAKMIARAGYANRCTNIKMMVKKKMTDQEGG